MIEKKLKSIELRSLSLSEFSCKPPIYSHLSRIYSSLTLSINIFWKGQAFTNNVDLKNNSNVHTVKTSHTPQPERAASLATHGLKLEKNLNQPRPLPGAALTPVQLPIGEPRSNQGPPADQACSIYLPHAHQKWVKSYCINASDCFRDKIISGALGTCAVVRIKGYTWCQLSTARLPCLVERRCRSDKTAPIAIKRWRFRLVLLGHTQLDSPLLLHILYSPLASSTEEQRH
jgi:hypothetical protein